MPDQFSKLQTFPSELIFRLRARHRCQSSERVCRSCLPDRTYVPAGAAPTSRLPLQDRRPIVPLRGQTYFHIFQLEDLVAIILWPKPIRHYDSPEFPTNTRNMPNDPNPSNLTSLRNQSIITNLPSPSNFTNSLNSSIISKLPSLSNFKL